MKQFRFAAVQQLPKYLFCENRSSLPGAGVVLCTQPPFHVGRVIQNPRSPMSAMVTGYSIGILITESLEPSKADTSAIAREMADFYYEEKVKPKLRYYQRYLE